MAADDVEIDEVETIDDLNFLDPESDRAEISTLVENDNDTLLLNSLPHHLHCACHTLSLIATVDTLAVIKSYQPLFSNYNRVIFRCNNLWKLSRSPKKSEAMKKMFNQALKHSVITRWNSLFDSLMQVFNLKGKIFKNATDLKKIGVNNVLTETDFR